MEWVRGDHLGSGNFGTISLAVLSKGFDRFPSLMAVKSSLGISSASLKNEKQVLDQIGSCPEIITCYGDSYTIERDGKERYNLFLEYANGGSLADTVKNHGGRLPESDVQRYTRAVLNGLKWIHANGFVHCDIKLANILAFGNGGAKIADFGLAKRRGRSAAETEEWRGTPLYMSPESVSGNEYEPPCDIWALGCAVVEMVTGKPAWDVKPETTNIFALIIRIGAGDEVPHLPGNLSDEGKDFLRKCFVKEPRRRWTAEMLLNHPFVAGVTVALKQQAEQSSVSPRGPFDFPEFASLPLHCDDAAAEERWLSQSDISPAIDSASAASAIRRLVTMTPLDWSVSDSWVTVR